MFFFILKNPIKHYSQSTMIAHRLLDSLGFSLEVLAHPFLQLYSDLLLLPLVNISHKHTRVKRAVVGVNAQLADCLLSIVQETHVGCLTYTQRTVQAKKNIIIYLNNKCNFISSHHNIQRSVYVLACPHCAPSRV